jgi:Zn-dependent M28 family amino/carboxypeptidase
LVLAGVFLIQRQSNQIVIYRPIFDGERAFADVAAQVAFGPRQPGTDAHQQTRDWIVSSLDGMGWELERREAEIEGHSVQNIVAMRDGVLPWIILGAHYDTRFFADADELETNHTEPVMGANDGASGVAVLLELARVLPADFQNRIWLVFFDAEDNGRIPGWDWILGSRAFVTNLEGRPDEVVILDMIGDADLNIFLERNSDPALSQEIWAQAAMLGYEQYFIPEYRFSMLDDHTPFLEAGITAIDVIDFNYPYWHTTHDTLDKVSPMSLKVVGDTILAWLLAH